MTESRQVFLLPFGTPTTTVAETPHPVVAIISPTPTMVTKMHRNQTPTNCAWNIWKARNRRVFDNKILSPLDVFQEIKAEMHCKTSAYGKPELSLFNV